MPPVRNRKRNSDQATTSDIQDAPEMAEQRIPTKEGSPVRTPTRRSLLKRRKAGVTQAQKQALIDNLQLEVTRRARDLRAQYHRHAQSMRSRIEVRVHRIPVALRKTKIGDLFDKYASGERQQKAPARTMATERRPPVPEKDVPPTRPLSHVSTTTVPVSRGPGRPPKRLSDEISGGDKENLNTHNPNKRMRASPAPEVMHNPAQVLSPASSNSRIMPRKRAAAPTPAPAPTLAAAPERPVSPTKSLIARPASPVKKPPANNLLSNMVEKAKSTRAAATTRKATTSSTASSAPGRPVSRTTRRGAAAAAANTTSAAPARGAAAARTARRVSGISESSDGSTSTVVRKRVGAAAPAATRAPTTAAAAKRTVMSTIKRGVAGATTRKAPRTKTAAAAPPPSSAATTTGTGRVLRKRG